MFAVSPSQDNFYHPENEIEIIALIKRANEKGVKIRVHGSGHSVPAAIHTGDFKQPPTGGKDLNLILDKMNSISFDEEKMQVTVQAGCHLGPDPRQSERYPKKDGRFSTHTL